MNLDIKTAVETSFFISIIGLILSFLLGIRSIQTGQRLTFFKKRHDLIARGWRLIFGSFIFAGLAYYLYGFAEPTIYVFFKPSPTITITPTITQTTTITLSPTVTFTASITPTSAFPPTPQLPVSIITEFTGKVTPNPAAVFSQIVFARAVDKDHQPLNPAAEFANPIILLYGSFSYDKMLVGSQWTALWVRLENQEVICSESKPWDGSTGGFGSTMCQPSSDKWVPGRYEVQIFIGKDWVVRTDFLVTGQPLKPTITRTATKTLTPTFSVTASRTITPTFTKTSTRTFTFTPTFTNTPTQKPTETPSTTPTPSKTTRPFNTPGFVTPEN